MSNLEDGLKNVQRKTTLYLLIKLLSSSAQKISLLVYLFLEIAMKKTLNLGFGR